MKKAVLVSLAILATAECAMAGTTPAGKRSNGTVFYSACVYQEKDGVFDGLCDNAEINKQFEGKKDKYGCFKGSQVVIKSLQPIKDCPQPPAQL